jgi:DNA repair exonuclease SbcCD ATPase subunit
MRISLKSGLALLLGLNLAATLQADPLQQALQEQRRADQEAITSQQRVEQLDDEARHLLEQWRQASAELERVESYNRLREKQLVAQQQELESLERQQQALQQTRHEIGPLTSRMTEVLEQFVALDIPFLLQERQQRVQQLRELESQPDTDLAERFRRLLEAYQIESEYGRTIEAYQGVLEADGGERMVDFLRIGRVGLFYRTLDGSQAGIWDVADKSWRGLDEDAGREIDRAIRVARKQLPPDLLLLPVPAAEVVQ